MDRMDVVAIGDGSAGDCFPVLSLAAALRRRGHRVRFVSNEWFRAAAEHNGLEFIPVPAQERPRAHAGAWSKGPPLLSRIAHAFVRNDARQVQFLRSMRWLYRYLETQTDPGRTVVLARVNALGARLARETFETRLITITIQPAAFRSNFDSPGLPVPRWAVPATLSAIDVYLDATITPDLNRFRKELGLPPLRRPFRQWCFSPDGGVALFPEWFGPRQADWPANTHIAGFALHDESTTRETPAGVLRFVDEGSPPIVFTRGSEARGASEFFRSSVEICRRLGRRGILLASRQDLALPDLPEFIRCYDFVPLSRILPRCAGLVHHAGAGTASQAFAAGIPQIAVPLHDDQPDNAARIERLGTGIQVAEGSYNPRLAAALRNVLDSDAIAARCRELAASVRPDEALAEACRFVEACA